MKTNKGKITLLIASIAVGLHGCYEGTEFRPAPIGGWSGAPRPAPIQSRPNAIIDNPDEASHADWDYIWATSEDEAIRKCRQLTEQNKVIYVRVQRASKNSKRYECHWRT